jgi:aminocarboxymuconate-semialdehyde decarboxylase
MIPFFHKRIEMNYQKGQGRVPAVADESVDIDRDLRRFYVDTVLQGARGALDAAILFFGADHVLFATDVPFGPSGGLDFADASLHSVDRLPLEEREAIFAGNAIDLLGIR